MKKSKYILSAILIFAALLIYGESRILNAGRLPESQFAHGDYEIESLTACEESDEIRELLECFREVTEKHNCSFFIIDDVSSSNFSSSTIIYCYDNDRKTIQDELALKSNTINSLILGDLTFKYENIELIPAVNKNTFFYFIGEEDNIKAANNELCETFGGAALISAYNDRRYDNVSYAVFGLVVLAISAFSFFQAGLEKKEAVIRVLYGEKRTTLFLQNIIRDAVVYLLIFVCEAFVLSRYDNVCEDLSILLWFYIALVFVNSLAYLGLFRSDAAHVMRGKKIEQRVLVINYIMKFCASLTVIVAVSIFYQTVKASEKYIKAHKFFSTVSDYSFCYFLPEHDVSNIVEYHDKTTVLYETLYREYSDRCEPIVLSHRKHDGNYIYANINAVDYISSAIDAWDTETNGFDFIIIQRETQNTAENDFETQKALDIIRLSERLEDDFSYKTVTIDEDYQLVAFDSDSDEYFTFLDNPIVIINTRQPDNPICDIENSNHHSMYLSMLFKVDDDLIDELDKRIPIADYTITSCNELYNHYLNIRIIELVFLGLLMVLSIIQYIALIMAIIRFEFAINQKELCIKKIIGYRLFSRYSYIIATACGVNALCAGIAVAVLNAISVNANSVALITCAALIICETAIICLNAARLEKQGINKILKDGAL